MADTLAPKWLELALDDLDTAALIARHGKLVYAAFHCQQATEKALKGLYALLFAEQPPYIHDLVRLHGLVEKKLPNCPGERLFLNEISIYYITARYPSYREHVASKLNADKVAEYIRSARECVECLRRQLK